MVRLFNTRRGRRWGVQIQSKSLQPQMNANERGWIGKPFLAMSTRNTRDVLSAFIRVHLRFQNFVRNGLRQPRTLWHPLSVKPIADSQRINQVPQSP